MTAYVVLHRTPKTIPNSDTLIVFVAVTTQGLENFSSNDKLIFHFVEIGMILKRESCQLRNRCRPSKIPDSEASVAQSKLLTVPIYVLALEVEASSTLGILIGAIIELGSARLAIFGSEDNGAWLEDHPDGTVGDNTVKNVVISSFEIIAKFSLENAVEEVDMSLGCCVMIRLQGLNEVFPAMNEGLEWCTEG